MEYKYQYPITSGPQWISCQQGFYSCYNGRVEKGALLSQYFKEFAQKLKIISLIYFMVSEINILTKFR